MWSRPGKKSHFTPREAGFWSVWLRKRVRGNSLCACLCGVVCVCVCVCSVFELNWFHVSDLLGKKVRKCQNNEPVWNPFSRTSGFICFLSFTSQTPGGLWTHVDRRRHSHLLASKLASLSKRSDQNQPDATAVWGRLISTGADKVKYRREDQTSLKSPSCLLWWNWVHWCSERSSEHELYAQTSAAVSSSHQSNCDNRWRVRCEEETSVHDWSNTEQLNGGSWSLTSHMLLLLSSWQMHPANHSCTYR